MTIWHDKQTIDAHDFDASTVRAGDKVKRLLAGTAHMTLDVTDVRDGLIHTKGGWTFRCDNGAEVDETLGWDGINLTGSFLVGKE